MRIAKRLAKGLALPILALGVIISPSLAANVLQCVPYARDLSGIRIHGDAWTWWDQAKGNYQRGSDPKPGAVISLANSNVMPLGHVAVVSRIVDDRRILLRHANWSGPGLIEQDVLAVDASPENDWSQVRIWWGRGQQMGARINPVNGFIYPKKVNDRAVLEHSAETRGDRAMSIADASPKHFSKPGMTTPNVTASKSAVERIVAAKSVSSKGTIAHSAASDFATGKSDKPRLTIDLAMFRTGRDTTLSSGKPERTLAMIVRDVKREARLR